MKNILLVAFAAMALTACASMNDMKNDQKVSEEHLQEKTSVALGIAPEKITISDKTDKGVRVTYMAHAEGVDYNCYFESTMGMKADAVCQPVK